MEREGLIMEIRLTESDLHRIVKESVKRAINEAENGGWIVDASEAQEAYNMAVDEMGEDVINAAIVRSLGDEVLAQALAYVFRMYEFRQWQSRFE